MMSSPAMSQGPTLHGTKDSQDSAMGESTNSNEEGVCIRKMRLKVLYTFDDQNKTNCLARWPHVLEIQTVAMDETTSIGVIELRTCIQAIVQCSPELVARLGQDYTVYAYDFSEYDNPLVGQGMLSWALSAASTASDGPAHQSNKLITGRVCRNILGLFANGVKETLEVKLRLVPVPTVLQSEYINAMDKYRELSKVAPLGLDPKEWLSFVQSNPNLAQLAGKATPLPAVNPAQNHSQRDGTSMEVVNQLLSPSLQHQPLEDPLAQVSFGPDSAEAHLVDAAATANPKKLGRPASRTALKRPRKSRPVKTNQSQGGNTSGYEEGTDGDDGPPGRKRAKITKADWNSKSAIGDAADSLRVAASTAGSLRLFRPIAANPAPMAGSHLQEIPRAPTPVPRIASQRPQHNRAPSQTSMRHNSFSAQPDDSRQHISPYVSLGGPEDQPRVLLERPEDRPRISIESAQTSPERFDSPADTPPGIGSSPPVMRTRPPSVTRSSPQCSSPVLPPMPRTDSGFMSGSLEDLFGEDFETNREFDDPHSEPSPELPRHRHQQKQPAFDSGFAIELVTPGPMELLPSKVPIHKVILTQAEKASKRAASRAQSRQRSRTGSVVSEDGQQTLPPLRREPALMPGQLAFPVNIQELLPRSQLQPAKQPQLRSIAPAPSVDVPCSNSQSKELQAASKEADPAASAPRSRPSSRIMVRTASLGSLTLPAVSASEPILERSGLHRSQTWSEADKPATTKSKPDSTLERTVKEDDIVKEPVAKEPLPLSHYMQQLTADLDPNEEINSAEHTRLTRKATMRQKLDFAIANGETPPFCANCGAIETPTWRKSWSQDHKGTPGYYEYSDAPGRVTCVNILTRDESGKPTSFQTIKKALLPKENKGAFQPYLLCNSCGLWMQKYKSQRPEDKWGDAPSRRMRSRPRSAYQSGFLTSDAYCPPSDIYPSHSDAYFPVQNSQTDGLHERSRNLPTEPNNQPQRQQSELSQPGEVQRRDPSIQTSQVQNSATDSAVEPDRQRSTSSQPPKRLKAMTSDAASAALRRAIQSSPARWHGTRETPLEVDVDNMGSTRRLLFPSPRKDSSPKVLGEMVSNIVQISGDFHVPEKVIMDAINKENQPPAIEEGDEDLDLLRLFGEEMARPSTPTQKSPHTNAFKTPTRPTPNHRPITRSVSKSIRSAKSSGKRLTFGQFTPTPRRSPRNRDAVFESPFTATVYQMQSETNSQTPITNFGLDFSNMPDLPIPSNSDFDINHFFSTGTPMDSSPPQGFNLYEDPATLENINWEEFDEYVQKDSVEIQIKVEPENSPQKRVTSEE